MDLNLYFSHGCPNLFDYFTYNMNIFDNFNDIDE